MTPNAPAPSSHAREVASTDSRHTSKPDVCVVIPTHNRRASLGRVLEALDSQTIPPDRYEVIVVCDGCNDGTPSMCSGLTTSYRLRVIDLPEKQGPAAARNRAVENASAEVIVFLDDDVVPDPDLIGEHIRIHDQDDHAVAIGPLLAPPGFALNPWTRWEAAMLDGQYRDMAAGHWPPTPRQFYTGNASVRRKHLLEVGGFDPVYRRAEDVELAYRLQQLKLTFHFSPGARGWHFARRSLRSWLGIAPAYGEADVAMYRSGRTWVLYNMAWEFYSRRRPLRRLARACVGRRTVLKAAVGLGLVAAQVADWTGRRRGADAAYSAIFNLCYWDRISVRLGGRSEFWDLIELHKPAAHKPWPWRSEPS
jgi:GT2 family glycosyltransferase